MFAAGCASLALPFLLRQRDAIHGLGHYVCAHVAFYALAILGASGGRATGILPALPMIPMFALLMRGGRAVIGWSAVATGILALGGFLARTNAPPLVAGFRELSHSERYPITLICIVTMLGVTLLFERLWSQSARELAARAQVDLARAKANYQNLVERSLQGIAVVCRGRFVYANQALADLLAVDLAELDGLPIVRSLEFVDAADLERVVAALDRRFPDESDLVEMRIRRGDGAWAWLQVRSSRAVWEGARALQIAYADVTAQKVLEASRQLEQERLEARIDERTRELEASQRSLREKERLAAVGTLAAGVAHQINNPVGAMLAAAEFAILAGADPDHERVSASALQEIRTQAIRCGRIIRSILQFARAEPTEKWSGDLVGVLRTALDATRRLARERGASVSLEIDRGVAAASLLMSPIELEQVFANLIVNAIEAEATGAQVRVSARRTDYEIEVCVEDDGPGIPPGDRARIFDPFFTTRLKGGGTGLGLSVAHGIIEDHGGRMELVHGPDGPEAGACFRVTLPLDKPDFNAAGWSEGTRRAQP